MSVRVYTEDDRDRRAPSEKDIFISNTEAVTPPMWMWALFVYVHFCNGNRIPTFRATTSGPANIVMPKRSGGPMPSARGARAFTALFVTDLPGIYETQESIRWNFEHPIGSNHSVAHVLYSGHGLSGLRTWSSTPPTLDAATRDFLDNNDMDAIATQFREAVDNNSLPELFSRMEFMK